MISTRNPATMTESERRAEIASLLGVALLRTVRDKKQKRKSSESCLDVSPESRLNGTTQPSG